MKDVIDKSCISQASTRSSTVKLSKSLRRTSYGQHCISFLAPSAWNNLPNKLKLCINLNTFQHKIKQYFFYKIRQKDNDIYLHDQTLVFKTTDTFFFSNFSLFLFLFFWHFTLSQSTYFVQRPQWKQSNLNACFSCVILATNSFQTLEYYYLKLLFLQIRFYFHVNQLKTFKIN